MDDDDDVYLVEDIIDKRKHKGKVQYKVGLEGIKNDPKVKAAFQNAIERQLKLIDKSLDLNPNFVFDYENHHALAKRIADESIILLKNEDSIFISIK